MTSDVAKNGCSKVVDLLVDHVEGNLPADTRQHLDQHLTACDRCVQQLRTYRATVSLLHGLCDDDLPPELRGGVRGRVPRQGNALLVAPH